MVTLVVLACMPVFLYIFYFKNELYSGEIMLPCCLTLHTLKFSQWHTAHVVQPFLFPILFKHRPNNTLHAK